MATTILSNKFTLPQVRQTIPPSFSAPALKLGDDLSSKSIVHSFVVVTSYPATLQYRRIRNEMTLLTPYS